MPNIENFIIYEHWQFDFIRHLFTLTVAVFAAGLVYFLVSSTQVAPRYRLSSYISAVVMVSATYEIWQLFSNWEAAFEATTATGAWTRVEGALFSNGFRYANWSIDVPMLLTQLLVVLAIGGAAFWSNWWKFTIAGLLMIWTGYIGQYYEPQVAGVMEGSTWPFWFWGAVSTVFFIYIIYLVLKLTKQPEGQVDDRIRTNFNRVAWLLVISWWLYPIAYVLPVLGDDSSMVVARQLCFTIADITSKLIFGVMLGRIARMRSELEGYEPALASMGRAAPGRVAETRTQRRA